jgi:predicted GIY-YIG superfamily endonuclease
MSAKTRRSKGKTYDIHDNGRRPFFVTVQGDSVTVEKNMDKYEMKDGVFVTLQKPRKKLLEMKVDHVFVGKKSPTGGYDGLKPSEAEGNSILVEKGSKYIYIGHEIYEFSPVEGDTIEAYYSDIGNSDVPYPYAVGKTHVYIMLEKAAVDKSFFDMKKGIYDQYYNATTRLDMCLRGFRDCEDKEKAKATRKEMKSKTRRMKSKLIQKRL